MKGPGELRAGIGRTPLERRALEAKLERLGVHLDPETRAAREERPVAGGLAAAAGPAGVLELEHVAALRRGGMLQGVARAMKRLTGADDDAPARALVAGVTSALEGTGGALASMLEGVKRRGQVSADDLRRLSARVEKLATELEQVTAPEVLGRAEPRQLDGLGDAYRLFLDGVKAHGDALATLLSAGFVERANGAEKKALDASVEQLFAAVRGAAALAPLFAPHGAPPLPRVELPAASYHQIVEALRAAGAEGTAGKRFVELETAPGFGVLSPELRAQALAAFARAPSDIDITRDILALVGQPGFVAGGPKERELRLRLLDAAASNWEDRAKVLRLLGSPDFSGPRGLALLESVVHSSEPLGSTRAALEVLESGSPAAQDVLREMLRHPSDRRAQEIIRDVAGLRGFALLERKEQEKLLRYIGGTNDVLSKPARERLGGELPSLRSSEASRQRDALRRVLTAQPSARHLVSAAEADFEPLRVQPEALRETKKIYAFKGDKEKPVSARVSELRVGGRTLAIHHRPEVRCSDPRHTAAEVVEALTLLPEVARDQLGTLSIESVRNPSDAHNAKRFGDSGFRSYMTVWNEGGHVAIWPTTKANDLKRLVGSLIHEAGHTLSFAAWGTRYESAGWGRWKAAMASDVIRPSGYSTYTTGEDFAEAFSLYWTVKGTPREDELRGLMPERFALLEELIAAHGARKAAAAEEALARRMAARGRIEQAAAGATPAERGRILQLFERRPSGAEPIERLAAAIVGLAPELRAEVLDAAEKANAQRFDRTDRLVELVRAPGYGLLGAEDRGRAAAVAASPVSGGAAARLMSVLQRDLAPGERARLLAAAVAPGEALLDQASLQRVDVASPPEPPECCWFSPVERDLGSGRALLAREGIVVGERLVGVLIQHPDWKVGDGDALAEAVGTLPPETLAAVREIQVLPPLAGHGPSAQGSDGILVLRLPGQAGIDAMIPLLHRGAAQMAADLLARRPGFEAEWAGAMKTDGWSVSRSAATVRADLAETLLLLGLKEAEREALRLSLGARMAIFDRVDPTALEREGAAAATEPLRARLEAVLAACPAGPGAEHLRRAVTRSISSEPWDPGHLEQLEAALASPAIAASEGPLRGLVLEAMGCADARDRSDVLRLLESPAFAALPSGDRALYLRVMALDSFLRAAAPEVGGVLRGQGGQPPAVDAAAAGLSRALRSGVLLPRAVVVGSGRLPPAAPHGAQTKRDAGRIAFEGGTVPAQVTRLVVDERTLEIHVPAAPPKSSYAGDPHQVLCDAFLRVPAHARARIASVWLEPDGPSDIGVLAQEDGAMRIYPAGWPGGTNYLIAAMTHEAGRLFSAEVFGDRPGARSWTDWERAMDADVLAPSRAAMQGRQDDFNESYALYLLVKGTEREAGHRKLLGARFELLDRLVG